MESSGTLQVEYVTSAASAQHRGSTIVARGQLDEARCVDMLIDTGATTCFFRRSCAERMGLKPAPLTERVSVVLADTRTTLATHAVHWPACVCMAARRPVHCW